MALALQETEECRGGWQAALAWTHREAVGVRTRTARRVACLRRRPNLAAERARH
jgi:hypothetical protein